MSATDLETKPVQEANVSFDIQRPLPHKADEEPKSDYLDEPSEDATPTTKSGVIVDPDAIEVCAISGLTH